MPRMLLLVVWCVAACGAQFIDELQQHEPECLGEDKFLCLDGGCIDRRLYCDFVPHCEDGSDENFCPGHNADATLCNTTHQFLCRDQRRCLPVKWLCNGESDCPDGSDEAFCTPYTPPDESKCKGFMCKTDDRCISRYWMCDGTYDCDDKSDEDIYESCLHALVPHERVIYDGMICSDGTDGGPKLYACEDFSYCLNGTDMCNGLQDCRDGSDEGPFCHKWGTMCTNETCGEGARCYPDRGGAVCVCAGDTQRYNATLRRCEDAGACARLAPHCSQLCLDEPDGFRCECIDGYTKDRLQPHLCLAEGSEAKLFYSTSDKIKYITLRTMQQVTVSTGHTENHGVVYDGNYLYWVEMTWGHQAVWRAHLGDFENSKEAIVSFGLEDPGDLAVDYLGGLLYISDMLKQIIGACTLDGKMCLTIKTNAHYPRFITLNVRNGTMFWYDFIQIPVIMYARMDGSDSRVLVANLETMFVSGLSVDPPSGRLYYVDRTIKAVRISDGKIYSLFKEGGQPHHPYTTAVFENNVYWNDWMANSIVSSDKIQNGTEDRNMLVEHEDPIFGLHVYHPLLYTAPSNPCEGHKCSHFCLLTSNATHVCACPDGMELVDDTKCQLMDKYRPQYVVIGGGAYFALLQHNSIALPSREATTFDIGRVHAMAYDTARDNLLVYDGQRKAISQIHMSTFSKGVTALFLYDELQNVVDMEYDHFSDLLYILDSGRRVIEVVSMASTGGRGARGGKGERLRALVHRFDDHERPLGMCLLPDYGRIWVAISEQLTDDLHIDSLGMDGQGRYHMVTTNLIGKYVRLRYNAAADRVLIADEATNLVEVVKPDGSGRETFRRVNTPVADLATVDHLVFWTGWRTQRLYWADLRQPMGIRRFDLSMFPNSTNQHLLVTTPAPDPTHPLSDHPCRKNTTCTHFCVRTSNFKKSPDHKGFTCICPIGMIYNAVKQDCVRPTVPACRDNELYCRSSNKCYPKTARCDGKRDCATGEDEIGCTLSTAKKPVVSADGHPSCNTDQVLCHGACIGNDQVCYTPIATERPKSRPVCPPEQFACRKDGACIDRSQVCDGHRDCVDRSDEAYDICSTMTCMDTEFMCTPGNCILKSWRCDGTDDCLDGSDELDCDTLTCAPGQFRCGSGECVDISKRCDAQPDCGDGSDEDQCVSDTDVFAPEEKTRCSVWEYRCERNTSICIPLTARCNRKWDCPEGTDEMNCESSACALNKQFTCTRHRTCIDMRLVCNGQFDCADGEDETGAACLLKKNTTKLYTTPIKVEFPLDCKTGFRCKGTAQCIEWNLVCNGKPDCGDGSDESKTCESACADKPCSSTCRATPDGPRCECPAGYEPRGRDCVDVDECAAPAPPCSHECSNMPGSYLCSCHYGYALRVDRHSCKAVEGGLEVLYASGNRVRTAPGEPHGPAAYLHPDLPAIDDIAVDIRKNYLYVTSSRNGTLFRTTAQVKEGSSLPISVTNIGVPTKVSVDWVTGNVYFVDETPGSSRIRVCHLDNRKCARLQQVPANSEVMALVVDPKFQQMFYCVRTTAGGAARAALWTAALTGQHVSEIAELPSCDGLAVDAAAGLVYVAEVAPPAITVRNYTGHTLGIEYTSDKYLKTPHGLQLFEDHIYYLNGDSFKLNRCLLYGRRRCESHMSRHVAASAFVIYHRSVQRGDLYDQCWVPLCPNICTMYDGDVACICPDGGLKKGNAVCATESVDMLPLFNGQNGLVKDTRSGINNVLPSVIGTLIMFAILFFFLARYVNRNNNGNPCTRFLNWCSRCRNVLRPRAEVQHDVVYRNITTPTQPTDELVNQDGNDAKPHEFANPFHHLVGGLWPDSFREQSNQDFGRAGGGGLTSVLTESPANANAPEWDEHARENLKKKLVF